MQTPAERCLVDCLVGVIEADQAKTSSPPRILNIGAGSSHTIESRLSGAGCEYVCDRVDVDSCEVSHPSIGTCWRCSVEDMRPVADSVYGAVFANYVLEHVHDLRSAAQEIHRVLKPAGVFVTSVPNPAAPEFVVSRRTPLWLHRLARGATAWETHYAYRSIDHLCEIFVAVGFETSETRFYSFIEGYLWRIPILNRAARAYDRAVTKRGLAGLMGNVCAIFKKPA